MMICLFGVALGWLSGMFVDVVFIRPERFTTASLRE